MQADTPWWPVRRFSAAPAAERSMWIRTESSTRTGDRSWPPLRVRNSSRGRVCSRTATGRVGLLTTQGDEEAWRAHSCEPRLYSPEIRMQVVDSVRAAVCEFLALTTAHSAVRYSCERCDRFR